MNQQWSVFVNRVDESITFVRYETDEFDSCDWDSDWDTQEQAEARAVEIWRQYASDEEVAALGY